MLTVVIGDIHGYVDPIKQLFEMVGWHVGAKEFRRVFLGDYIDRGPHSKQVIDFLIETQRPQDVFLMGNHEDMFLHNFHWYGRGLDDFQRAQHKDAFFRNGGYQTMQSYGWTPDHEEVSFPRDHITFFQNLKLSWEDERRFYCHAGIDPGRSLEDQRAADLMWIRDKFLMCKFPFEKYIVHGHTPKLTGRPDILSNRCNMDTGGCFEGVFSAAIFDDTQDQPIHVVTVPGRDAWSDRP